MKTLWRSNMHKCEHVLFVFMALSTCIVCHNAMAQDRPEKAKVFLVGKAKQPPVQQHASKAERSLDRTLKPDTSIPYNITILQYLAEKRGRIPVYSGLNGKVQLEFGLSGYLGIKCLF